MDFGRSTRSYFMSITRVVGNARFSAGAVSMDPFEHVNRTNMRIRGAKALKTVEVVMRK